MIEEADQDERLKKSGQELFKELYRIYSVAEVEDYWKHGVWKDELMRTDIVLIEAHRREAGAEEPPPLSEVVLPEMPKVAASTARFVAGVARPAVTGTPAVASGAVAELRLVALFVAKWKLDPNRTKAALSKLIPVRRRYTIANFKTEETGEAATTALEEYIEECDTNNTWPAAPEVTTPAPAATSTSFTRPIVVPPVKRPLSAVTPAASQFDPSKRFRPATPVPAWKPATTPSWPGAGFRPAAPLPARPKYVSPVVAPRPITPRPITPRPIPPRSLGASTSFRPATSPYGARPPPASSWSASTGFRPATPKPVTRPVVRPASGVVPPRPGIRPVIRPVIRPAIRPVSAPVIRRF
eukprot:TRINITY_DN10780_c0_g1_i1.p1 TRINITY_DN10780_c0_g1~~TRINITY_DN10780_c0_g1_i1.p1  ORF type:complete len:355 (+),score=61.09 TRINITY_DN10780_c0_g1_i1:60-1124(+)